MSSNPLFRRIVLLGTPVVVAVEMAFLHPSSIGDMRRDLFPIADFWLALHVAQLVLFGLMGLAAYLLIDGLSGIFAIVGRLAIAVYVVFYNAADSVAGIATGILSRGATDLSDREQAVVAWAVTKLFGDPAKQLLYLAGSYAWSAALLAAALALYRAGAPRLPLVPLALAALPYIDFFGLDHSPPFNPIALALFFVAALWLEFAWRKRPKGPGSDPYIGELSEAGEPRDTL